MFRVSPCRMIIILLLSLSLPAVLHAQTEKMQTQKLKAQAGDLYAAERYQEAYEAYRELLKRYPKDGMFNYYAGISLLKQKKNLPAAIEHLDRASSSSTVPDDVYLYLGQAYHENYQFRESKSAYMKYSGLAGKSEAKEYLPERQAHISSNAMALTLEYNPFEVLASSLFTFSDSAYVKQVRGKGGQLCRKPAEFYGKDEQNGDLTNFMFLPKRYEKGDYVFISGYGKPRKKGADLYRVKRVSGKSWGEPKAIDELNTEYDEIMPYFDPISKDLYFASDGHNSMGGYDVFKSHYDEERDTWSQPVSMGFPVNSPRNDFLVLPGSDLGTVMIITDRQGMDSMLTVYKLHLQEPKRSLASASAEELKKIGNLGGIESIPAIVDMKDQNRMTRADKKPAKATEESPVVKPVKKDKPGNYQSYLKAALACQVSSDSLSRLAKKARIEVMDMQDPNERWELQKKIIEWEKYSRDYQEKADLMYAKMKENDELKNAGKSVPPTIKEDTVINDIKVYSYNGQQEKKTQNPPKEIKDMARQAFAENTQKTVKTAPAASNNSRFMILDKSPYSIKNPFPHDVSLPAGAFYRIQLGVFSQPKAWDAFGGISPVTSEKVEGKSLMRYYAGKFERYQDASVALEKVRQSGYPDAYIVSWYDGQRTSINRVIELEKRDTVNR